MLGVRSKAGDWREEGLQGAAGADSLSNTGQISQQRPPADGVDVEDVIAQLRPGRRPGLLGRSGPVVIRGSTTSWDLLV